MANHNRLQHCLMVLSVSVFFISVSRAADDPTQADDKRIARTFANRDRNKDEKLSQKEFLANRKKNVKVAERDFRLFDFDSNGFLNLDEFSTASAIAKPDERGTVPDPILFLVDRAVIAMDKSFDNWDQQPEKEINASQFIAAFVATLGSNTTSPNVREADENGDQRVSRAEARRFMEIQLGVRRGDGKLLREPAGRVVNFMLYQFLDLNKSDKLERAEFLSRSYLKEKAGDVFKQWNTDEDDALSFDEWWHLPYRGAYDALRDFRRMDTNLDALVDPKELDAGTPEWKKSMAANVFPGFDQDADGKLTLNEFRLTMLANPLLRWHRVIKDPDGDMELSFKEFKFDTLQFPLLRWIYFQRLDVNGDQMLDTSEFYFTTKTPDEFFVLNADGTGWRSLFRFEGFPACGSPAVSPDGKRIAFDAWSIKPRTSSTMFVMSIDGTDPRKLVSGMMPNWSKDGKMLACSRSGVRIVDADDGSERKLIERGGWGAQWSPDGEMIAFTQGTTIKIYDVETEAVRVLLEKETQQYRQVFWNMSWSFDSKRLCFTAKKPDDTIELATVNVTGDPEFTVHHSGKTIGADTAWHPSGNRVVFTMHHSERGFRQLYGFNPNNQDPPKLIEGQDETRHISDMCWTPDGKRLIVVSGDF